MITAVVGFVCFGFGFWLGGTIVAKLVAHAVNDLWGDAHRKLLADRLKGIR